MPSSWAAPKPASRLSCRARRIPGLVRAPLGLAGSPQVSFCRGDPWAARIRHPLQAGTGRRYVPSSPVRANRWLAPRSRYCHSNEKLSALAVLGGKYTPTLGRVPIHPGSALTSRRGDPWVARIRHPLQAGTGRRYVPSCPVRASRWLAPQYPFSHRHEKLSALAVLGGKYTPTLGRVTIHPGSALTSRRGDPWVARITLKILFRRYHSPYHRMLYGRAGGSPLNIPSPTDTKNSLPSLYSAANIRQH